MCSLYDYVVVYSEQSKERQRIGDTSGDETVLRPFLAFDIFIQSFTEFQQSPTFLFDVFIYIHILLWHSSPAIQPPPNKKGAWLVESFLEFPNESVTQGFKFN